MNREEMCRWCRIPAEQLVNHPESKIQLKVYDDKNEVSVVTGNMMAEEVIENGYYRQVRWDSIVILRIV